MEWTQAYEEVIHLAQEKAHAKLADCPFSLGYCHFYWGELSDILLKDYGIEWRSPAKMNPRVKFD